MSEFKNSEVLKGTLQALYAVTSRKTSENFAAMVIGAIIKTLTKKYDFLKYVKIKEGGHSEHGDDVIDIASDVESVGIENICKAVETIVRIVYMDLKDQAGVFFIKEIRRRTGESIISKLREHGVDLELMELEQHYLRTQQVKRKPTGASVAGAKVKGKEEGQQDDVSLLGYNMKNVSSWKYDPDSKTCTIFGPDSKKLDTLDLDIIIKSYISKLSGEADLSDGYDDVEISVSEKEFELLEMLHSRDMDAESALALLQVSHEELDSMIRKLTKTEMLHYISADEVELTEFGINNLSKKENNDEKRKKEKKPY